MWTGGMTVADSIVISLVGLLVVFSALAVLAIAVIIISKVIGTLFKESAPKAAAAVAAPAPAIDEESYAVPHLAAGVFAMMNWSNGWREPSA